MSKEYRRPLSSLSKLFLLSSILFSVSQVPVISYNPHLHTHTHHNHHHHHFQTPKHHQVPSRSPIPSRHLHSCTTQPTDPEPLQPGGFLTLAPPLPSFFLSHPHFDLYFSHTTSCGSSILFSPSFFSSSSLVLFSATISLSRLSNSCATFDHHPQLRTGCSWFWGPA